MTEPRFIAVFDVGKTNAKLVLHDLAQRADLFVASEPNGVRHDGPYPHYDTDRLWSFLLASLAACAREHRVDAISVTTHGACAALVDGTGLVLPVLDYESALPEETGAEYERLRPGFEESFSPGLPCGLNLGRQLHWLERRHPEEFARARHILPSPQYWVWRLTGVAASEVTSLGCHTDLWAPESGSFSSLVGRAGWQAKFPPLHSAFTAVGPVRPEIAEQAGLRGRPIPVHCGIHDSNASLLPHILGRQAPLSVVSTGTWVIALSVGGALAKLDPARDMLANVDALGRPVPSSRFMGGREYDLLTGRSGAVPSAAEVGRVLDEAVMALPTFSPGTGPFPSHAGHWTVDPAILLPGERAAAASLYLALMTEEMLGAMAASGPTIVEGPFARNDLFLEALGALTDRPVLASSGTTGTSAGAALLAVGDAGRGRGEVAYRQIPVSPDIARRVSGYGARWRSLLDGALVREGRVDRSAPVKTG
jgi:sugar (pentulose or hexulose) kinase